jgi:hypothetical protein
MKYCDRLPNSIFLTIPLIDVYGLIRISDPRLYLDAKNHAGPVPIDLPITIKSFDFHFKTLIQNSMTLWASLRTFVSLGVPA